MNKKNLKTEHERQIISLWLARQPEDQRTENAALGFCGWLEQSLPDLLRYLGPGDPCQHLKCVLRRHIRARPPGPLCI